MREKMLSPITCRSRSQRSVRPTQCPNSPAKARSAAALFTRRVSRMKRSSSSGAVMAKSQTPAQGQGHLARLLFGDGCRAFVEQHLAVAFEIDEGGMSAAITATARRSPAEASTSI